MIAGKVFDLMIEVNGHAYKIVCRNRVVLYFVTEALNSGFSRFLLESYVSQKQAEGMFDERIHDDVCIVELGKEYIEWSKDDHPDEDMQMEVTDDE